MKTVIVPIAAIYTSPDLSAELADEMIYGATCDVISEEENFYQIKTYYGYSGYITKECVIDTPSGWDCDYIVTCSTLDVMPTPEYRCQPIITLPRGSFLSIDETVGEKPYVGVVLADGTKGFCVSWHVKKRYDTEYWRTHEVEMRESLVRTAMQYLSVPYRWGGKTPYGIDCSGLCSAVYLQHEILIWRDANLTGIVHEVTRDELKPGDLIFFPGHVAMYIGGNRYIHSNQRHSGVCINSFDPFEPDYNESLLNSITGMGSVW